jgi:ASCH domain
VEFSKELRDDVIGGAITVSFRLWQRPKVRVGGRYRVGEAAQIEVDAVELLPFAAITAADVRRSGEPSREALRHRAAHAGPIGDDTLLYRVEFHVVGDEPRD